MSAGGSHFSRSVSTVSELESGVKRIRALFSLWKDCAAGQDTFNLNETAKEISIELNHVEASADALTRVIAGRLKETAPGDPARASLEADGLFIREVQAMLKDVRGKVEKGPGAAAAGRQVRDELFEKRGGKEPKPGAAVSLPPPSNPTALDGEAGLLQEQMVREQDGVLGEISVILERLKQKGEMISNELEQQDVIITELTADVDHTQNRMNKVTGQLDKLLKNKDSKKFATLIFLIIVLFILTYIALFT